MEEGDIIKFGRVRFKIRKLRILDKDDELSESNYSYTNYNRGIPEATVEDGLHQTEELEIHYNR